MLLICYQIVDFWRCLLWKASWSSDWHASSGPHDGWRVCQISVTFLFCLTSSSLIIKKSTMVISMCSFTLNGPGFSVNSHFRPLKNTLSVKVDAIRWPSGTTAIWAEIDVTVKGSLRYQKNWFKKERSEGSSLIGTVRATCSIGEFSIPEGFSGPPNRRLEIASGLFIFSPTGWNCYNNLKLGPKNKNQAKIIKKKKKKVEIRAFRGLNKNQIGKNVLVGPGSRVCHVFLYSVYFNLILVSGVTAVQLD